MKKKIIKLYNHSFQDNIEEVDKPITPHPNPQINEFGQGVRQNYNKVKKLLGL